MFLTEWELFHRYRRLAEAGTVKHLTCPDHPGTILVTRLGENDRLALWCVEGDTTIYPGLDVVDQVRAVVSEHWVEEDE